MSLKMQSYYEIIDALKEAVNYYNKFKYRKNISLYLSNGETFQINFLDRQISHLLGMRFDKLLELGLIKKDDSFTMLKELLKNAYNIYKKIESGELSMYDIFSAHIKMKLDNFHTVINFYLNDIKFVVNHKVTRAYLAHSAFNYYCDYYVAFESIDNSLIFLGLKYDQNSCLVPASIIGYPFKKYDSKLSELIAFQNIAIVNEIDFLYSDRTQKNQNRSCKNKIALIKELKEYCKSSGANIDVTGDYTKSLSESSEIGRTKNVLKTISEHIANREPLDEKGLLYVLGMSDVQKLKIDIIKLVSSYNLLLESLTNGQNHKEDGAHLKLRNSDN